MIIGVPTEVKTDEYRVAMLPVGVEELVSRGHQVLVQSGAGLGSGLADHDYLRGGAEMVASGAEVFARSDLVIKVKEPQQEEFALIRSNQLIFTYFHFAASRELTEAMMGTGATCLAYETLRDRHGRLPLLTPMSEVAGRMSIQEGAKYLERPQMGRGILLGGVPGVAPAHITVLGGGVVGANAARIAAGFQADVAILDVKMPKMSGIDLKRALQKKSPTMKFIFMTGHGSQEDFKDCCEETGAGYYLIKPVDIEALINKIKEVLKI